MLWVKVIDNKDKVIEIKDLTGTGLEMAIYDCKNLLEELEEERLNRGN
jgi:hypothetical protein